MKNTLVITNFILFITVGIALYFLQKSMPLLPLLALEIGNGIMFGIAFIAHMLVLKQLDNNPSAFVRGVSGASLLKIMICMFGMLIYIVLNRNTLYKPTIFVFFGIYAVYTVVETILLSKIARRK
jgi:hypothetical protein